MARKRHLFFHHLHPVLRFRVMIPDLKFLKRWMAYGAIACLCAILCAVKLPAIATDITPVSVQNAPSALTQEDGEMGKQGDAPEMNGLQMNATGYQMRYPQESKSYSIAFVNNQTENLEQQARTLYEAGRFAEAVERLQQALAGYREKGDAIGQAIIWSNLSLSHQHLGAWGEATQAIDSAFALLKQSSQDTPERSAVWAQALDVQGSLQLAQGKADQASKTWEQATQVYNQLGDSSRATLSRINQAQALQALGLYRQASLALGKLQQTLQSQPDSLAKAANLRSLGDALRSMGILDCQTYESPSSQTCARQVLEQSLNIATKLQSSPVPEGSPNASQTLAAAKLSLGNVAWAQRQVALAENKTAEAESKATEALRFYQQAIAESVVPIQAQTQLNRLHVLVELKRWEEAQALYPQVQQQIANLPPGREKIYAQVNLAINLRKLSTKNQRTGTLTTPGVQEIAQILADARQQAERLGDVRSQAHVLQELGQLYEKTQQWSFAQDLAQQSLNLSQSINASEISYQAAWELGRVLKEQKKNEEAIAAYTEAYQALRSVRSDLIAASADVQFSFRESVEPVYRELVDLLLQSALEEAQVSQKTQGKQLQSSATPIKSNQNKLKQAREVLEALQVAALQNYFQQACQDSKLELDQVVTRFDQKEQKAAVIYPIILNNRLEVILKLPDQEELYQYPPIRLSQEKVKQTLDEFQNNLRDEYRFKGVRQSGQIVYDWLIKPVSDRLEASGIKTLIFILDGPLRTIPMSALYDGNQFLVEKYSVSLVLGLEVRDPVPLNHANLKVLAASLTEPPKGFEQYGKLPNVNPELDEIQKAGVSLTAIRDKNFTSTAFNKQLNQDSFQVVHLATHGQFGADRNSTYILTADKAIYVDELSEMFRNLAGNQAKAVDLLVLSACKTASGNDRAVLGIAGTTVQAGARSAIAGLWSLADASSVKFSQTLYQYLGQPGITRAEALRQAQLALLQEKRYQHPRYWAPYVLVGAWL
jgi:CHAT domain-containing protein